MRDAMATLGDVQTLDLSKVNPLLTPVAVTTPTNRTVQLLNDDLVKTLERFKPTQRKGTANLKDLTSLIDWVNRFKGETTALFADPDTSAPKIVAIADYHAEGPVTIDGENGDPTARHCQHKATFAFPISDEWKAWTRVSGEPMTKENLAEFIDEHALDVLDPTPAMIAGKVTEQTQDWEKRLITIAHKIDGRFGQLQQLMQMSRQFTVHETSNISVTTNRDTGESEISFVNEHKDQSGNKLKIPNLFTIAIPVFVGSTPYRMAVRFRYRKVGGDVRFILQIYNADKVFKAAMQDAVSHVTEETKIPAFYGTAEQA